MSPGFYALINGIDTVHHLGLRILRANHVSIVIDGVVPSLVTMASAAVFSLSEISIFWVEDGYQLQQGIN